MHIHCTSSDKKPFKNRAKVSLVIKTFSFFSVPLLQANMKAQLVAQKFPANAPSYKCIPPAHEVSNKGVYVVTPSVLTVTNNS